VEVVKPVSLKASVVELPTCVKLLGVLAQLTPVQRSTE
jgi:hypothetical protein